MANGYSISASNLRIDARIKEGQGAGTSALLLETGDNLLLETGDFILLET